MTTGWYKREEGEVELLRFMDDITAVMKEEALQPYLLDLREQFVYKDVVKDFPSKLLGLSIADLGDELRLTMEAYLLAFVPTNWGETAPSHASARNREANRVSRVRAWLKSVMATGPNPKEARSWLGRLGWLSSLYPHLKVPYQALARQVAEFPAEVSREAIKWMDLLAKHRLYLSIKPVHKPEIRIYADASFKRSEFEATVGVVVQLADQEWPIQEDANLVFHRSALVKRLVKSTFAAELEAAVRGIGYGAYTIATAIKALFGSECPIKLFTDSRSLYSAITRRSTDDVFSQTLLKFLIEKLDVKKVNVNWVPTQFMKADCLTKVSVNPHIYSINDCEL